MTNKEQESLPTLDEAIQLFAQYARGEGDFDELDLKEVIYAHKPDVNEKDETVESIVDDLLLGHRAWADLYLGGKALVHEKRVINNRKVRAISALNAHYKAKYEVKEPSYDGRSRPLIVMRNYFTRYNPNPKRRKNSMSETWYQKSEREAAAELEKILARPDAPTDDYIGIIDENTNKSKYFNPWDLFDCFYGSYSSEFDEMAVKTLENLVDGTFDDKGLAHEMFREVLCNKNLCDYGTSPRVCFPTAQFKELLPKLIERWKRYYEIMWEQIND